MGVWFYEPFQKEIRINLILMLIIVGIKDWSNIKAQEHWDVKQQFTEVFMKNRINQDS